MLYEEKTSWYTVSKIPKRSGGIRIIEAPAPWLKEIQRKIYEEILLKNCAVSAHAFGCIKKRNIQMAAEKHVGSKIVLKIDLKDFFHTITDTSMKPILIRSGIPAPTVERIAYLCTNSRGVLPQGSPTSPSLANIVAIKMYKALHTLASRMGLAFSGYLDDLIFSGENAWKALQPAKTIIKYYGFTVSKDKISIMRRKREVLGLCVAPGTDHTRLPKKQRNQIRAYLHCLRRDVAAGKIDNDFLMQVQGLVAFAEQAQDQKAGKFKAQMVEIREMKK